MNLKPPNEEEQGAEGQNDNAEGGGLDNARQHFSKEKSRSQGKNGSGHKLDGTQKILRIHRHTKSSVQGKKHNRTTMIMITGGPTKMMITK